MRNQASGTNGTEKENETRRNKGANLSLVKYNKKENKITCTITDSYGDETGETLTFKVSRIKNYNGQTWAAISECEDFEFEAYTLKNLKAMIANDSDEF